MVLTVRDALKIDVLKNAKVVAGYQGLDNVVESANIMETPEVAAWMKGGELLITAGYALKNSTELRKNIIYELAKKGVAAFGIRPGKYFKKIPEDMIEHANKVGLPLIELPPDVPYIDMMLPILELVINDQRQSLRKSKKIHDELLKVVFAEKGITGVCKTLFQLVGNPVLVVDSSGNLLSSSLPFSNQGDFTETWLQNLLQGLKRQQPKLVSLAPHRWHRFELFVEEEEHDIVIVPLGVNSFITGYLVIVENLRILDAQELIALEDASIIVALELVKEKAIFEAEKQVRGELLEDLINGNFRDEETVIRRASYLNFDLASRLAIFVIGMDGFENSLAQESNHESSRIHGFKGNFFETVHAGFLDYPGGALFMVKSNCITGLVNVESQEEVQLLQQKLTNLLDQIKTLLDKKFTVSIGVGRPVSGVRYIKQSYEEAQVALKIGRFLRGPASLTFFDELGPYLLLYEVKDSSAASMFFHNTLGKVLAYDQQNNAELLKTLVHYFRHDGNQRLTAKSLYIHKNSVAYRLKLIEQLTGLKLNNPEDKFNLQLCLKLGQIIGGVPCDVINE